MLMVKFLVGAIKNLAVKMFVRQRRGCIDERKRHFGLA